MNTPSMLSVFDGRALAGFLLNRGKTGWEAFSSDEVSLGIFPTQQAAASAIPLLEEAKS